MSVPGRGPAAAPEAEGVLAANEAFYEAFNGRDFAAMEALWSKDGPIACIHPGWNPITDRDQLMESWQAILANPAAPEIVCLDPQVLLLGESALVVCYERLAEGTLTATNLFRLEDGAWRMVHHHAGLTNEAVPEQPAPRRAPPSPSRSVH